MAKEPANPGLLASGAGALAILDEKQRALEWIERALLLLDPDNFIMRYNLACALAVGLNEPDRAIDVLEPYFEGTKSATHVRHADADPDLDGLRENPRFKAMVVAAKERLGIPA
jgi:adenylate cyclase